MGLFGKRRDSSGYIDIKVKKLIDWDEPNGEGCIVSNRITKDGFKVGYMTRSEPMEGQPDSGWRFWAGNEDDSYSSDPSNCAVFALNTVCNYDPDIIPYLHSPAGSELIRIRGGKFEVDDGSKPIFVEKQ